MAAPEPHGVAPGSTTPAVQATDVRITLGSAEILHGVSLEAMPGEVVALMGGNGSGKSTFVRGLVGVLPLDTGSILFGGEAASAKARARIGYVPQRLSAAGGVAATVAEVVTSGLLGRNRLRPPRGAHARVMEALDTMGVASLAKRDVGRLSGGQQQRVLIARALVRKPELLILDEPMAGVDLESQVAFSHALGHLKADGTSLVIVLHELGAIGRHIDRAVVLEQGCVTYAGAPLADLGVHALPGHDHDHPHEDPEPLERPALEWEGR
ncbi:metal ABC transporter ATP-binding protein [Demequina sp.]|uniref:metal ABC transporter ATP-binding protein n=1 Tax=Demequina sp. TaxID=2050685 RepID=UPI003A85AC22